MSRMAVVSSMLVISVCVLAVAGHAQLVRLVGPEREMFVYDGDLETDSGGITVTRWGSGEAESVYETTYIGPQVLKVKSQGPYQGIVLHLSRSGDLGDFLASDAGYVDLRLQPAQTRREIEERQQAREERRAGAGGGRAARGGGAARGGRGGAGMRGGGGGAGMRGGREGGGMRGGGGGAGMRGGRGGGGMRGGGGGPGMRGGRGGGGMRGGGGGAGMRGGARRAGGGAAGAAAQQRARPGASESGEAPGAKVFVLKNVRVVLFSDQGMTIADSVPVDVMPKDKHGWTRVSIPLSQFKGIEGATSLRAVG
ncbi:MAG: hypothetical protein JSV79_12890, partial [Armatimonadota bacterium]